MPVWEYIGTVGDRDPIAHGGGLVYEDTTGIYDPEISWFVPAPDEQWHKTEGATPVTIYRILIEHAQDEWWYEKLPEVARFCGSTEVELQVMAKSSTMQRALLYSNLIGYFGPHEFDQEPQKMTEEEAYEKYAAEMKMSLRR